MHEFELALERLLAEFQFESETQKKGLLAIHRFLRSQKHLTEQNSLNLTFLLVTAYMIQKQHESNVWWGQMIGDRITELQNEIDHLRNVAVTNERH